MKTIPRHLKAVSLVLLSVLTAPFVQAQSSGAISVDRSVHYVQTDASTVTAQETPYSFIFHVRGGSLNMANWGPAFYKPGSSGVPQSGSSSSTNTGTLNFPAVANNGTDYMFVHDFETDAAMKSFYPIAPTDGGEYGVKFLGSSAPTPAIFTDGLVYPTTTTYPTTTPQVVSANNGAVWSNGKLVIQPTGITTLGLNSFTEYSSTTYGSLIAVGIFNANGAVVAGSESYYLPVGDSTENPAPIVQPAITSINVSGASLVPGHTYTLEIQYTVIAGRPEEANLNGVEFQGVSSYRRVVSIAIVSGSSSLGADLNNDGKGDILWQDSVSGGALVWLMNGTSYASHASIGGYGPETRLAGSGDFNADGHSDLLWQNHTTGECSITLMNGTTPGVTTVFTTVSSQWTLVGSGDFNSDGQSDVLWKNPEDEYFVWFMNGTNYSTHARVAHVGPEWRLAGTGDFNGDGQSDLIWQHAGGECFVWLMNGASYMSHALVATISPAWRLSGSGDFNSDGQSDLIWRHESGEAFIWLMNGTEYSSHAHFASVSSNWNIVN